MKEDNTNHEDDFWTEHRRTELAGWLRATPEQRLCWLEDAIRLAYATGALPKKDRA